MAKAVFVSSQVRLELGPLKVIAISLKRDSKRPSKGKQTSVADIHTWESARVPLLTDGKTLVDLAGGQVQEVLACVVSWEQKGSTLALLGI